MSESKLVKELFVVVWVWTFLMQKEVGVSPKSIFFLLCLSLEVFFREGGWSDQSPNILRNFFPLVWTFSKKMGEDNKNPKFWRTLVCLKNSQVKATWTFSKQNEIFLWNGFSWTASYWWDYKLLVKFRFISETANFWWDRQFSVKLPYIGESASYWWDCQLSVKHQYIGETASNWLNCQLSVKLPDIC